MDYQDFDLFTCFNKNIEDDGLTGDYYFDSYANLGIHQQMLKDKVRTQAYLKAITSQPDKFKDKYVLDIGCGTGILSIFASRAGAKHVYAIEKSGISKYCKKIIQKNGLDKKITIISGDLYYAKLPVQKVDIIVSQWMGYFLLYQSMLDCVLWARDKWLKADGQILPDRAQLHCALLQDEQYFKEKIQFWEDVYGVDMSCLKKRAIHQPLIDVVSHKQIVSNIVVIKSINLKLDSVQSLNFTHHDTFAVTTTGPVRGLIAWFDCLFTNFGNKRLSTSPYKRSTHWKQTTFYLQNKIDCSAGDKVQLRVAVRKALDNFRNLQVKLGLSKGKQSEVGFYKLS